MHIGNNVIAAALAQFEREDALETVRLFEELVEALPDEFRDWDKWFEQLDLPAPDLAAAAKALENVDGAGLARELLPYGLTPAAFMEAFSGYADLFDLRSRDPGFQPLLGDSPLLQLEAPGGLVSISEEDLVARTAETPGLPDDEDLALSLVRWTLAAGKFQPSLIPRYFLVVRRGRTVAVRRGL